MGKAIRVRMTEEEITYATNIGCRRQVQGMIRKVVSGGKYGLGKYGADNDKDGFQYNCIGALGEAVVAKYLNVAWDGAIGNFKAKDVGDMYQVRSTHHGSGCLILHKERDKDDDIHILVIMHKIPAFYIPGWMYGHEGKVDTHWKDKANNGRWAHYIEQPYLNSMDTLPRKGI